jgi:hypothetical protein
MRRSYTLSPPWRLHGGSGTACSERQWHEVVYICTNVKHAGHCRVWNENFKVVLEHGVLQELTAHIYHELQSNTLTWPVKAQRHKSEGESRQLDAFSDSVTLD